LKFQEKAGTRQGADHYEMTALMLCQWNKQVAPNDVVYHLGDVSFGTHAATLSILKELNGIKHLIKGNHDSVIDHVDIRAQFASIQDYKELKHDGEFIVMCHYPFAQWNKGHYGAFHFFGHCHGNYKVPAGRRMIDVGVDNRPQKDMGLWSWEELKERMLSIEMASDMHH
jgi:calcineurin-like phosphoesterase family protein